MRRAQALQDKYGGWAGEQIVQDFSEYARVVFKALGRRVNHWTSFNEPWSFCVIGYGYGIHAPGVSVCPAAKIGVGLTSRTQGDRRRHLPLYPDPLPSLLEFSQPS